MLRKSRPRQIRGSEKNAKPVKKEVPLISMAGVVSMDAAIRGTSIEARIRRGFSWEKGAVGERAL